MWSGLQKIDTCRRQDYLPFRQERFHVRAAGFGLPAAAVPSNILPEYGPKMAARDEAPGGLIVNRLEDLETIQHFAGGHRLPMPLTGAVAELHRLHVAAGLGKADNAATMRLFDGFQGGD